MRIGYFSDSYLPKIDGIAYSIESFRKELESRGHEVFIFAASPSLSYREKSPNIIRFPALKGLFYDGYLTSLFFPPQAIRKIEKLNLDIVHFHTPGQIGLLGAYFALRKNIPLVTTYHTDLFEYVKHYPSVLPGTIALSMLAPVITGGGMAEYRSGLTSIKPEKSVDKWNQKIVERGVTMIHNHCDLVIAPSNKIRNQLLKWHTKSRVVTLPTGVDAITTTKKAAKELRATYGLKPDDEVILFVGRIGTEKNIGMLISAFERVASLRPRAKLLIFGAGDDLKAFKEQAAAGQHADRVIFAGAIPREQLGAAYTSAKIFAFPSVTDTQGLSINEAAQAGLPIVMVDHNVSLVVEEGENGHYSKNDARQFASKIVDILRNEPKREAFSEKSVKLASDFTVARQASKLIELYEEAIENHPKADPKPSLTRTPWQL